MSQMTLTEFPFALDGGTYDGNTLRNFVNACLIFSSGTAQMYQGVLPGGGSMVVSGASGMNVSVATGFCAIADALGNTYGGYTLALTSAATLAIAVADTVNPRIDLVYALVVDNGNDTSYGAVAVMTGSPASSPAAPAPPAGTNYLPLATVLVPANSTSSGSFTITTNVRTFTTAVGGILPVQTIADAPAGYPGSYVFARDTAILWQNPPSGPVPVQTLPFPPVMDVITSQVGSVTSSINLASITFTTPGNIDIKATFDWPGILGNGHTSTEVRAVMTLNLDGTQIAQKYISNPNDDSVKRASGTWISWTSGAQSTTPAAGTHTVTVAMLPEYNGTNDVYFYAASNAPMTLRVEPVNQ